MRIARWLPLWLVALALTGCAGYKLGPSNGAVAGGKSVQVMPFSNQTMEPRLGEAATAQLRKELQRDGTYQLASHDDGDVIVSGVIVNYIRIPLSFQPSDALTVTDYSVKMGVQVTARRRRARARAPAAPRARRCCTAAAPRAKRRPSARACAA